MSLDKYLAEAKPIIRIVADLDEDVVADEFEQNCAHCQSEGDLVREVSRLRDLAYENDLDRVDCVQLASGMAYGAMRVTETIIKRQMAKQLGVDEDDIQQMLTNAKFPDQEVIEERVVEVKRRIREAIDKAL